MKAKIISTGICLPARQVTNDDLAKCMETSDEWIGSRTGIRRRRIAEEETVSKMASTAACEALKNSPVPAEDIDLIIVATSTADLVLPCVACAVQSEIGAVNAACFDLNAACSGFLFAMNTMEAFMEAGIYRNALIIGSDMMSRTLDWSDRGTCVLFGDGAGAVLFSGSEDGNFHMLMQSDGGKSNALTYKNSSLSNLGEPSSVKPDYLKMDGQEVFKFACRKVPESITRLAREAETELSDVSYFFLHQANLRIVEAVAKRLGISMDHFPVNLDNYGNTSAASIPILLHEWRQKGLMKEHDKIVIAGFGAGLSWGAALLEW